MPADATSLRDDQFQIEADLTDEQLLTICEAFETGISSIIAAISIQAGISTDEVEQILAEAGIMGVARDGVERVH